MKNCEKKWVETAQYIAESMNLTINEVLIDSSTPNKEMLAYPNGLINTKGELLMLSEGEDHRIFNVNLWFDCGIITVRTITERYLNNKTSIMYRIPYTGITYSQCKMIVEQIMSTLDYTSNLLIDVAYYDKNIADIASLYNIDPFEFMDFITKTYSSKMTKEKLYAYLQGEAYDGIDYIDITKKNLINVGLEIERYYNNNKTFIREKGELYHHQAKLEFIKKLKSLTIDQINKLKQEILKFITEDFPKPYEIDILKISNFNIESITKNASIDLIAIPFPIVKIERENRKCKLQYNGYSMKDCLAFMINLEKSNQNENEIETSVFLHEFTHIINFIEGNKFGKSIFETTIDCYKIIKEVLGEPDIAEKYMNVYRYLSTNEGVYGDRLVLDELIAYRIGYEYLSEKGNTNFKTIVDLTKLLSVKNINYNALKQMLAQIYNEKNSIDRITTPYFILSTYAIIKTIMKEEGINV